MLLKAALRAGPRIRPRHDGRNKKPALHACKAAASENPKQVDSNVADDLITAAASALPPQFKNHLATTTGGWGATASTDDEDDPKAHAALVPLPSKTFRDPSEQGEGEGDSNSQLQCAIVRPTLMLKR